MDESPNKLWRLECPELWDRRHIKCRLEPQARCVVAACGEVSREAPLVIRWDARLREEPAGVQVLVRTLADWGYRRVQVIRGFR